MRWMAGLAPSQIHLLHSSTLMAQAAPAIKLHWCLVLDDKVRLIVELCRASAICLWRLTSVMKRKVCWFDDAEELIEGRRKVRTCQDCGTVVHFARTNVHGLPDSRSLRKLNEEQMAAFLQCAVKQPTYIFASPLHARSKVVSDLASHYDCKERLESALNTVNGGIRVASDIIYLRSIGKLRIRLSIHRETDRFTKLLCDALSGHACITTMMSGRAEKLKVLFLNCYFARTALSEASRVALYDRAFPFFKEGLFGLPLHDFLWTLCDHLTLLLQVTNFQLPTQGGSRMVSFIARAAEICLVFKTWSYLRLPYISSARLAC